MKWLKENYVWIFWVSLILLYVFYYFFKQGMIVGYSKGFTQGMGCQPKLPCADNRVWPRDKEEQEVD